MEQAEILLVEAMAAQVGIVVAPIGDVSAALQTLYRARKTKPDFSVLTFHRKNKEIWIVKKPVNAGD